MVLLGFLTVVAGVFLFVPAPTPAADAGKAQAPPPWVPFEMNAIMLYRTGVSQENSDPQGALKTLRQAREESTAAISHGGGGNPAVEHNDALIGHALAMALTDAAKTSEKDTAPATATNTATANQNQKAGNSNNPARSASSHFHVSVKVR